MSVSRPRGISTSSTSSPPSSRPTGTPATSCPTSARSFSREPRRPPPATEPPRARLLFVAHREEILAQSLATFRQGLRDHAFGELWVGGQRPRDFEHVFASIQSLSASGMADIDPAHFDVVIVDEFHHAAARSYETLLEHVKPVELLGLTATP